jgi:hypothetical protein
MYIDVYGLTHKKLGLKVPSRMYRNGNIRISAVKLSLSISECFYYKDVFPSAGEIYFNTFYFVFFFQYIDVQIDISA